VNYTLTGVTALSGIDYQHTGGTITITAGTTGTTRTLATSGDIIFEDNETFHFILSSPSSNASISDATGVVTILDDDIMPEITITSISITEGGTGAITLRMVTTATGDITIDYTLTGVTATSGLDYQHTGGTITIPAGSTGATKVLATSGDLIYEGNETFHVILSNPSSNATILIATGVVTITDDDSAPTISVNDISITE